MLQGGLFVVAKKCELGCVDPHRASGRGASDLDFFSRENLRLVYKKELAFAKAHVQAQKKPNNGNALSKEKRNKMLEFKIDCVHCGTLLSGNNYNTEHILDVSLGGQNSMENKMLMCKICNSARAELKVSLLGNQPTMAQWDLVEAYVLWSYITVDHGHASGANIPSVHREFLRLASGGRERERNGTRWFARASNTSLTVSSGGNSASSRASRRDAASPSRRWGLLGFSLRDWLRGSAQDQRRHRKDALPSASLPIPPPVTNAAPTPPDFSSENADASTATLKAMVLAQIPTHGEIKQAQLGNQVKHNDPQERSLRDLFIGLGHAKSKSMNTLLEGLLSGEATFRDEGTVRYWSKGAKARASPGKRNETVQSLFRPHLSTTEFMPMSTLLGRVRYADSEKRSTKTLTTLAGYPKSWGLLKILKDAFGDDIEVEKDEDGKGMIRVKALAETPAQRTATSTAEKYSSAGAAFKKAIAPFLPEAGEQRSLSQLSNVIQQAHASDLSLKRLGIELGFPKTWTARKMIEHAFGESIVFTGSGPATYLQCAQQSIEDSEE
ncbi:MAG: hypothetical protein CMB11_05435 [Euryarchaeota archaeon]|nr:hypothetical protein [Euryarchaeota archaeon]